jgi:hypothetical protein
LNELVTSLANILAVDTGAGENAGYVQAVAKGGI